MERLEDRTLFSANTYTVNLATDTVPFTGQSTGATSGDLRWCIEQANANPGSTIVFDPTVFSSSASPTIELSQGELDISANMTITGLGPTITTVSGSDGKGGASRVFDISNATAVVSISGLTITNGNAYPNYRGIPGNQGGDIFNAGSLTLTDDVVSNGLATGQVGGFPGRGGGIFNATGSSGTTGATLVLNNVTIEGNKAEGELGGAAGLGAGGGIYNDANATTTVEGNSQFLNNQALGWNSPNAPLYGFSAADAGPGEGGGIFNKGTLNLNGTSTTHLIFNDNEAIGGKGGDGAHGLTPPGSGSGTSGGNGGNGGAALGGGVYNTSSAITLQYVDFTGNQANGGTGGDGGHGGDARGNKSWNGGPGGNAGTGGYAEGGGIYNGVGALSVPNVLFGTDSNGTGNEANGGNGGNGGSGGNAVSGTKHGGHGGNAGTGANAGLARGGAVANFGGDLTTTLTFTSTTFVSSEANGGTGGHGGVNGLVPNILNGTTVSTVSGLGGGGGIGGAGGNGGAAGNGGLSQGGAVFNQSSNLSFTNDPTSTVAFTASEANGGSGGGGGTGGTGGGGGATKSTGLVGGLGGLGGVAGNGGSAQGGGFYNVTGTVTISGSNFEPVNGGAGNFASSGNGGSGGNGGPGGQGGDSKGRAGTGGDGGAGGNAGAAGFADGGAGGNQGSHTSISKSIITSSYAQSGFGGIGGNGGYGGNGGNNTIPDYFLNGYGGSGGNAGAGGNSAPAYGGAIGVTTSDLLVNNGVFGSDQVIGGAGGNGGVGGTVGQFGHPGGYWNLPLNGAGPYLPHAEMNPAPGAELAGNGGNGGIGATVSGGAISTTQSAQAVTITSTTFSNDTIIGGKGGDGGSGGLFATADGTGHDGDRLDINGNDSGVNGTGGDGGSAIGGTLSFSTTSAQNASLSNVSILGSSATGGKGGAGNINMGNNTATSPAPPITPMAGGGVNGGNGWGSAGGNGGSVQGVDVANVNYNLSISTSTLSNGTGVAGSGGTGGGASFIVPFSWEGGAGGVGGSIQGGAVFFSNALSQTTLDFSFNHNSASNNSMQAGNGGFGGDAGASTTANKGSNVTGGAGGNGGNAQGGGLYILTGDNSVTVTSLDSDSLLNDTATGGIGGIGGAGFNSIGGVGGSAQGGAIYNNSVNVAKPSSLSITAVTMAGDQANGGAGGRAGTGTTPNGGAGGPGGSGGSGDGGALYNGDNTPLTVINSTLGGNGNYANVVTGGVGGRGGNAGTPHNVASNNGGPGGNGGSVAGGNVFISSNSATFEDDTIVFGSAAGIGGGGAGGGAGGTGGQKGPAGADGTGVGGGIFTNSGTVSGISTAVANTIIAFNIAQTNPDVAGAFTSMNNAGHNIISVLGTATGFSASYGDQIGVTVAQMHLGPLQNNGGPNLGAPGDTAFTLTEALQGGSIAIGSGNAALVPATVTTDQRGPTFARIVNGSLDVGAYQTQVTSPPINPPPPPGSPPPPPQSPTPPPGSFGLTTISTIVGVQNSYQGLVQIETVYANVSNVNGYLINQGVVTFQVNGQTIYAPVHNGVATASFATGLLDVSLWQDLLYAHPLTVSYGDGSSVFAPSGTGTSLPAIWLDFFLSLLSSQLRGLNQLQ